MTPAYRIRVSRLRILMVPQGAGQHPAAPGIEGRADEAGARARGAAQAAKPCDGVSGYGFQAARAACKGDCPPVPMRRTDGADAPEDEKAFHDGDATPANGVRRLESDSPVQPPMLRMRIADDAAGRARRAKAGDRWRFRPAVIQLADGTPEPAAYLDWEGCEP